MKTIEIKTDKLSLSEIERGNVSLAKFMNFIWMAPDKVNLQGSWKKETGANLAHSLHFDDDWEWIMPVVDKVNSLGVGYSLAIFKTYVSLTVESGGKFYKDFSFSHAEYITSSQNSKEAIFKLLVKFVDWYYENGEIKINRI